MAYFAALKHVRPIMLAWQAIVEAMFSRTLLASIPLNYIFGIYYAPFTTPFLVRICLSLGLPNRYTSRKHIVIARL